MTMLDRMRRHKGWLKWSLALVVLTFVVFYIPDFLTTSTGAAPSEVLADVEGEPITVGQFTRRYNAQVAAYRNAYGGQMNDQLLKQLGIDRQILQQLVDEEAMVAESRKQGITVSDVEIRERILALPGFQENGRFIGEQRYRPLLQMQNPPMTTAEFERSLRRALQIEKLRNALTGWMSVNDADVAAEYRRRNEKVKLDVVLVTPEAFKNQVTGDRRRADGVLREVEGQVPHRREAQDQVRDRQCRSGAPDASPCPRPTSRRSTSRTSRSTRRRRRCAPATSCSSSKARTRSRCRRWPRTWRRRRRRRAPISPRSPSSIPKTTATTPTAATSITSAAAAWSPSSSRRRSR